MSGYVSVPATSTCTNAHNGAVFVTPCGPFSPLAPRQASAPIAHKRRTKKVPAVQVESVEVEFFMLMTLIRGRLQTLELSIVSLSRNISGLVFNHFQTNTRKRTLWPSGLPLEKVTVLL